MRLKGNEMKKAKKRPIYGYVELSEDKPPNIWQFSWYRSCLRQDLLHQKVELVLVGKPMKAKKHYGPHE
jgi:hypothetical protein